MLTSSKHSVPVALTTVADLPLIWMGPWITPGKYQTKTTTKNLKKKHVLQKNSVLKYLEIFIFSNRWLLIQFHTVSFSIIPCSLESTSQQYCSWPLTVGDCNVQCFVSFVCLERGASTARLQRNQLDKRGCIVATKRKVPLDRRSFILPMNNQC